MKINKLTASFGKLENETLTLHNGLNVIYAPNESGKSTWCAFIRAMLYGVDSSERSRSGYLPDKLRYAPWSGAPMEGSMELTSDRCDITISRSTKTKSAPMREFSACYTGTSTPVEGLNGLNAGEMLTGVLADVFRRSAFIEQGAVDFTASPELEKRISAIVSTGEEQVSYSEADERLRSWQRKRRFNRRGLLPELEAKADEAQRTLDSMSDSVQEIPRLEEQLEATRQQCAQLEAQVTESRKKQRKNSLERLNDARAQLKLCGEEHDKALTALSERKDELRRSRLGSGDREEVEKRVNSDLESLSALKRESTKKGSPLLAIIFFVLAAVCAGLYSHFRLVPLIIAAALFCVAALVFLTRLMTARRIAADRKKERQKLLERYHAGSAHELRAFLDEYLTLWEEVSAAEQTERETRQVYEDCRSELEELEEKAITELDFSGGNSEAALLGRQLNALRADAERISAQIAGINGRLAAMGDPMVLASSLSCMRDEQQQLKDEYDAITLAVDTLREADSEIQSRFSPELGRVAAEYMSTVTDGRYADVLISKDFTAKTRTQDDTVARDAEYLSAGTLDLMYLAVRLAVCELALPSGEPCPLIIDDALVNLDEARAAQATELLDNIAKKRQVILFTCRK